MSRIREEAHELRLRDAVSRAMHATGTTVTSAGPILAATFGVSALTGATEEIGQLGERSPWGSCWTRSSSASC